MISDSINSQNNKMILHKIQEFQQTTLYNHTEKERKLLDSIDLLEQKSSTSLSVCINTDQNKDCYSQNNNERQNQLNKNDSNNTYIGYDDIQQNKSNKCNDRIFINIFGNQTQNNQNKNHNDYISIQSPIFNSNRNIDECLNLSNCTTQNLFTSMTDRIPYNLFQNVLNIDKDDQNKTKTTQNICQQHQENKEFDIFSFTPLKMKPKNTVQKDEKEDFFEIELFIKQQKLQQLNHVVEQAESIVVDLSDRENDFENNSFEQEKNNLHQQLPLILQPSFFVQNISIDQQLQNQLNTLPFQQNDSTFSLNYLENNIERCQSRNSVQIQDNQLPKIKRLCSEPLRVSTHKDKKKISSYSKKQSTPKIQRIQSHKLIKKLKSDKKQKTKQLNINTQSF